MNMIKFFLLASILHLAACAPPRPAAEAPANEHMPLKVRKAQTKKVSAWEIRGAMAAKQGNKGWSASLNWLQRGPHNYQLRLFGPLGGGAVKISRRGNVVSFQDGPKEVSSTNATQLLREQTGISLPVNNLYYWVRGLNAPGSVQSEKHDSYNHLTKLKQAGYTIIYSRYTSVNGTDLPSKIRLVGHGVTIKLIVKQWNI